MTTYVHLMSPSHLVSRGCGPCASRFLLCFSYGLFTPSHRCLAHQRQGSSAQSASGHKMSTTIPCHPTLCTTVWTQAPPDNSISRLLNSACMQIRRRYVATPAAAPSLKLSSSATRHVSRKAHVDLRGCRAWAAHKNRAVGQQTTRCTTSANGSEKRHSNSR